MAKKSNNSWIWITASVVLAGVSAALRYWISLEPANVKEVKPDEQPTQAD